MNAAHFILHVNIRLFGHGCSKRLFCLHCIALVPLSKIHGGLFLDSLFCPLLHLSIFMPILPILIIRAFRYILESGRVSPPTLLFFFYSCLDNSKCLAFENQLVNFYKNTALIGNDLHLQTKLQRMSILLIVILLTHVCTISSFIWVLYDPCWQCFVVVSVQDFHRLCQIYL